MKKQIGYYPIFISWFLTAFGCSFLDEDAKSDNNIDFINTLDQNLYGNQGHINEYFYNFNNDVEASFFNGN